MSYFGMTAGVIYLVGFVVILTILSVPFGKYIAWVFNGEYRFNIIEKPIYKLLGQQSIKPMNWVEYTIGLLIFNIIGILFLLLLELLQAHLPMNPQATPGFEWSLAINTAISFVTNTNWQAYTPETSASYLLQMLGFATQNFLSASTGIAVLFVLIRGLIAQETKLLGNLWEDLVRITLYILLPISIIYALFLVYTGVPQNTNPYVKAHTFDTIATTYQTIPMGPVASQEAIKLLGTNGGGFFNANSAHPYENPSALSNLTEMLAIALIPAALCFAFGILVKDRRQGYTIYIAMTVMFVFMVPIIMYSELHGNPLINKLHVDSTPSLLQSGGNMEGKETRFGILDSSMFTSVTTATSCGAINTQHDSLMPLSSLVPLLFMQISEVAYGGVGSGLFSMLVFVILTVFITGLMIGRTPEYLGKKIESFEMKMVAIVILVIPMFVLVGTAISLSVGPGLNGISNSGAHGLTQILYAFTSATNNNGSAFAGINSNSLYYNLSLAICMFMGRFGVIVPIVAIAGSLAFKKHIPVTSGTMPTHGFLFMIILIGIIVIIGILTYIPALALGPIVEHLNLFIY